MIGGTATTAIRSGKQVPALDGLRGVAVLIVVVSHSVNAGFLDAWLGHGFGQFGVALFYVLSAYLMAALYGAQNFSAEAVRTFGFRRIGRILPLYIAVVLSGAGLWSAGVLNPFDYATVQDIALSLTLAFGTGVLWSIPVEIQFYIFFVGFWFVAAHWGFVTALSLALAAQIALAAACLVFGIDDETLPFWLHFFLLGILAHFVQTKGWLSSPAVLRFLSPLALLVVCLVPPQLRTAFGILALPTQVDPIMLLATGLSFWMTLHGVGPFRALSWKPLRQIGKISFGIYLLHMPVLHALRLIQTDENGLFLFALTVGLSFLLAWVSFAWYERPVAIVLRRWEKAMASRKWEKPV